jgi:4-alpha-glucanotransferase
LRFDGRVADVLGELAAAFGVATQYWNWRGEHVAVAPETLRAVLAALGVDAATDEATTAALRARRDEGWARVLPPYVVAREGRTRTLAVHVSHGDPVEVEVLGEDGVPLCRLDQLDNWNPPREVAGRLVGEASFRVPDDLPAGYHRLVADTGGSRYECELIVAPGWLGLPPRAGTRRMWGLATQLYSVRSRQSWGVGDLIDLADLAAWTAGHGGDYVLVNPLHAAEPVPPIEPSPYLPTSRRFANPIYLRIERIPEYVDLDPHARTAIGVLAAGTRGEFDEIDRDNVWSAKRAALAVLYEVHRTPGRDLAYRDFCDRQGSALEDFATWCALAESYGTDWHLWPAELRHPRSEAVEKFRGEHPDVVGFHRWLQWVTDEQLAQTQAGARSAGLALGIMHDLAVGVNPDGADAWAWQDDFAYGVTVGAPPDPYAQTGQNWSQPPWRPDRLAATGYAPFRDLIRSVLRNAGGLRVDHIIGLFRLWWIPAGKLPTEGTYVRYDHEALVGILTLEAHRAGAIVVGEDLGTVEPWVRDFLRECGVLGTSVLWFEFDWDAEGSPPLPPNRWREFCLASVTTHDLPPSAGYLAGDHVRLRHELGLLTRTLDEELAADAAEQGAWLGYLHERGLLAEGASEAATVSALHRALRDSPARLRCLALTDAVGERRTQNQPGTHNEYPNWRVPLGDADGAPMYLEDVFTDETAARLAEAMRAEAQ